MAVADMMCKSPKTFTEPPLEKMHVALQAQQFRADTSAVLLDRAALDEAREGPCSTGEKVRNYALR